MMNAESVCDWYDGRKKLLLTYDKQTLLDIADCYGIKTSKEDTVEIIVERIANKEITEFNNIKDLIGGVDSENQVW